MTIGMEGWGLSHLPCVSIGVGGRGVLLLPCVRMEGGVASPMCDIGWGAGGMASSVCSIQQFLPHIVISSRNVANEDEELKFKLTIIKPLGCLKQL